MPMTASLQLEPFNNHTKVAQQRVMTGGTWHTVQERPLTDSPLNLFAPSTWIFRLH